MIEICGDFSSPHQHAGVRRHSGDDDEKSALIDDNSDDNDDNALGMNDDNVFTNGSCNHSAFWGGRLPLISMFNTFTMFKTFAILVSHKMFL